MPRPRSQLPHIYEQKIREMALLGCSAREIHRALNGAVSLRTVQRRRRAIAPPPEAEAWTLAGPDWGKADLVLPVLAEVIARSGGRVATISRDLARWIARVRRAAPDLPLWEAYELANEYRRASEGAEDALPLAALDAYLAFKPWQAEGADRWRWALESGAVSLFRPGVFTRLWRAGAPQAEEVPDAGELGETR